MAIAKDEVSFITGAGSGFGKGLSQRLVAQGGRVVAFDIDEESIKKLADELNTKAGRKAVLAVKGDTTVWEEQVAAWEAGVKEFGRIDYAFANAGIAERPWIPEVIPTASYPTDASVPIVKPNLRVIDIDLNGQLYTAALALQSFNRQKEGAYGFRGKLILTASVFGLYPSLSMPMYTAAKAGIVAFTRSQSLYFADKKITINAVAPNLCMETSVVPASMVPCFDKEGLTSLKLILDAFESPLGDSTMNGHVLGVNKSKIWNQAADPREWEANEPTLIVLDREFLKLLSSVGTT